MNGNSAPIKDAAASGGSFSASVFQEGWLNLKNNLLCILDLFWSFKPLLDSEFYSFALIISGNNLQASLLLSVVVDSRTFSSLKISSATIALKLVEGSSTSLK